jgi:hypothetical protein
MVDQNNRINNQFGVSLKFCSFTPFTPELPWLPFLPFLITNLAGHYFNNPINLIPDYISTFNQAWHLAIAPRINTFRCLKINQY